jgi:cyclomaltodextrinase / maltogenic alpha-amylase / neopullulanase
MDFIFGTLATDELKLVHHRAARQGLQHNHHLTPNDPLPDQPVTLTVTVGPNISPEQVICYYTVDGSEPLGERGQAQNGHVLSFEAGETFWDTLVWGYLTFNTLAAHPASATRRDIRALSHWRMGTEW